MATDKVSNRIGKKATNPLNSSSSADCCTVYARACAYKRRSRAVTRFSKLKWNWRLDTAEYSLLIIRDEMAMSNDASATLLHERNPLPQTCFPSSRDSSVETVCYIGITMFHAPRGRPYSTNCREQWRYAGRCGVYPARRESFLIRLTSGPSF